jgi:hypothetical protein
LSLISEKSLKHFKRFICYHSYRAIILGMWRLFNSQKRKVTPEDSTGQMTKKKEVQKTKKKEQHKS